MKRKNLVWISLGVWIGSIPLTSWGYDSTHLPPVLPKNEWSFQKLFGTFNRAELQRGFQVYKQVCSTCHSLKHLRYDKLRALGFREAEIKALAQEDEISGAPDDEGNPTKRKATPADFFKSPYPNENAARAANNGSLPPDLTLIVKARPQGADYLKGLLTGYESPPSGFKLAQGMHYNKYFPGHQIGMPAPLTANLVEYADKTPATVEQMAHDVTAFLAWAAEPELEERKQLGIKVFLFLSLFAACMYFVNRRTWAPLKGENS